MSAAHAGLYFSQICVTRPESESPAVCAQIAGERPGGGRGEAGQAGERPGGRGGPGKGPGRGGGRPRRRRLIDHSDCVEATGRPRDIYGNKHSPPESPGEMKINNYNGGKLGPRVV